MPSQAISDPTLDFSLRSWVESANDLGADFPLQNLPLCMFLHEQHAKVGVGIGDSIVDVDMLMHAGFFGEGEPAQTLHRALHVPVLNVLMRSPVTTRRFLREKVQEFLKDGHAGQQVRRLRDKAMHKQGEVQMLLPWVPPDYTDFYASIHHARNVGSMFRPDNPLLPNYKHVPIGYHGRASSIVVSGSNIRRPVGQSNIENAAVPVFGPSKRLDYELEFGCIIADMNRLGDPVPIGAAPSRIFGFCLVNDWSARDIQAWEYQPLGPFLAKNFGTTVSPWIVTVEAMQPFRIPGPPRESDDPAPLPYLRSEEPWALDVHLEVLLQSSQMREKGIAPVRLSRGNVKEMFWTFPQMIAHHAGNGCNLQPGDLLASGTVSGPGPDSRGCMLELTWQGNGPDGKALPRRPVDLPSGETRTFLADGDTVTIRGWCEREGFRRIGFGECTGTVCPAQE